MCTTAQKSEYIQIKIIIISMSEPLDGLSLSMARLKTCFISFLNLWVYAPSRGEFRPP